MASPLRLLRNWLHFGDRQAVHTDLAALKQWLDGHTRAPAADMAAGLAGRIPALVAREKNLHMRLRLLDALTQTASEILPRIEAEIAGAPLPLPPATRPAALAADNLLKALAAGYAEAVATIENRRLATGLGRLLQGALLQATRLVVGRQDLAYRVYALPSAATWQQLNQMFRLARSRHIARTDRTGESIETIYTSALLLALADPSRHSRADLDPLRHCCRRLAPLAHLSHGSDLSAEDRQRPGLFLVAGGRGLPAVPLSRESALPADALVLDATPAITALAQEQTRDPSLAPLAETLATLWRGEAGRRFSRARFKPKADLVTGVPGVAGYLQGAFSRRRGDPRRNTVLAVSEWYIVNQSPDGFGLRFTQGEPGHLDVGDLVGLRPRERSRVHICLIRRVNHTGPGRFELGLQELSPLALPIPLAGGDGILLPRLPGFGNAAGLVAPGGLLRAGALVTWSRNGRSFHHRLARRVDGNRHTDLFLLA